MVRTIDEGDQIIGIQLDLDPSFPTRLPSKYYAISVMSNLNHLIL